MPAQFQTQLVEYSSAYASPSLLLTHLTSFGAFVQISSAGEFRPAAKCPIYNDHLFYAFYGRPAFRFRDEATAHHAVTFAPVCFLLKSDLVSLATRIMPFDSGGFHRYGPAMHPTLTRDMYEMMANDDSPRHVAGALWGTNLRYFDNDFLIGDEPDPAATALLHYRNLIGNKLSEQFDVRCSSVEIQLASPLKLAGNVRAVVLPNVTVDGNAGQMVRDIGADLLTYAYSQPFYVNDFLMMVRQAVRDYLKSEKLM